MNKEPEAGQFVILCVDDETEVRQALVRDLQSLCGSALRIEACTSAEEAKALVESLEREHVAVPLVIVDHKLPGDSGIDLLIAMQDAGWLRHSRKLLLSARATKEDLTRALNQGALNGSLGKPWTESDLHTTVRFLLTEYFIQHAPDEIERMTRVLDVEQLSYAFVTQAQRQKQLAHQVHDLQMSFLSNTDVSDEDAEKAMVESMLRALDHPPPKRIPKGTRLLEAGKLSGSIYILLSGEVQLSREVDGRDQIFHRHTVGRIIGLLSLALGQVPYFDCKALTDIEVLQLSLEDLDRALHADPELTMHFVPVLVRSLARRNRRSAQMQMEIRDLNQAVAQERDQLSDTIEQLKKAQLLLVQHEKMATLGQMAAGIAHELNNPVAAIHRAADFLQQDLFSLAEGHPDHEALAGAVERALKGPMLSTREQRARRKELTGLVGDERLASAMVDISLYDPAEINSQLLSLPDEALAERLAQLKEYYDLGRSLRNIHSCSERITGLVKSLRSYARTGTATPVPFDLHEGLEETILLFGHDLRGIEVHREYDDLPEVACMPGELNQVWTNLVSNAIQAMQGEGALTFRTDRPDPDHVRVQITDNGPGIAAEHIERIFEVNFTTRQGRADFGLGIGLPICRDIVERHGGELTVESRPGCTCFSVVLPVHPPPELETGNDEPPGAST